MAKKQIKKATQPRLQENPESPTTSNKVERVKSWIPIVLGLWGAVLSTYLAVDKILTAQPKLYVQSSVVVDGVNNDGEAIGHVDAYLTNIGESNVSIEAQAEMLATNARDGNTTRIVLLCSQMGPEQSDNSNNVLGKPPVLKPSETAVCNSMENLNLGNIANPMRNYLSVLFHIFGDKTYYAFIANPQFLSPPIEGTDGRSWMGGALAVKP